LTLAFAVLRTIQAVICQREGDMRLGKLRPILHQRFQDAAGIVQLVLVYIDQCKLLNAEEGEGLTLRPQPRLVHCGHESPVSQSARKPSDRPMRDVASVEVHAGGEIQAEAVGPAAVGGRVQT
jgi:hypothetical protein